MSSPAPTPPLHFTPTTFFHPQPITGLTAAKTLLNAQFANPCLEVVVLEGRGRVGGRVYTATMG